MAETRTYEHIGDQLTESVTVHIDDNGYIRMTATNLHDLLEHLGFEQVTAKKKAAA